MIVEIHVKPPRDWKVDKAKLCFPFHGLVYASRIEDRGDLVKLLFNISPGQLTHIENDRFEVLVARSQRMDGYILRKWRYIEPVNVAILSQMGGKEPSPKSR